MIDGEYESKEEFCAAYETTVDEFDKAAEKDYHESLLAFFRGETEDPPQHPQPLIDQRKFNDSQRLKEHGRTPDYHLFQVILGLLGVEYRLCLPEDNPYGITFSAGPHDADFEFDINGNFAELHLLEDFAYR